MIIVVVVVSFVGGAVTDVGGGEMRRESELRRERERKKGERERKRGREVDFADRGAIFHTTAALSAALAACCR